MKIARRSPLRKERAVETPAFSGTVRLSAAARAQSSSSQSNEPAFGSDQHPGAPAPSCRRKTGFSGRLDDGLRTTTRGQQGSLSDRKNCRARLYYTRKHRPNERVMPRASKGTRL